MCLCLELRLLRCVLWEEGSDELTLSVTILTAYKPYREERKVACDLPLLRALTATFPAHGQFRLREDRRNGFPSAV
jgi:hypothetical protein